MIRVADRFHGINAMQRELRKQKARIIRDLRNLIFALPENPNITVLSTKPRCFVMNSSDLSSRDWTPEYYNFDRQYRAICREIRHKKFEEVMPFLRQMVRDGLIRKIEFWHWGLAGVQKVRTRVNIHPQVIKNIQRLL